jgi:tRNA G18 (ribose-2'-O)-methylase SpoU
MFLGVDAIVVNRLNQCGLTPVVSKVSSGALEFTPIYNVKFVAKFF